MFNEILAICSSHLTATVAVSNEELLKTQKMDQALQLFGGSWKENIINRITTKRYKDNDVQTVEWLKSACESNDEMSTGSDHNRESWAQLPQELLEAVLIHLRLADVASCSQTCRRWHNLICDDGIWRKLVQRDFKLSVGRASSALLNRIEDSPEFRSWSQEYKKLR